MVSFPYKDIRIFKGFSVRDKDEQMDFINPRKAKPSNSRRRVTAARLGGGRMSDTDCSKFEGWRP